MPNQVQGKEHMQNQINRPSGACNIWEALVLSDKPFTQGSLRRWLSYEQSGIDLLSWGPAAQWLGYKVPCVPFDSRSGVLCAQGEITWFILKTDFMSKIIKGKIKVPLAFYFPQGGRIIINHFTSFGLETCSLHPAAGWRCCICLHSSSELHPEKDFAKTLNKDSL